MHKLKSMKTLWRLYMPLLIISKEAAVVCILGTGSNCSYYDGEQLHQRVKSLGYTLMDDASG